VFFDFNDSFCSFGLWALKLFVYAGEGEGACFIFVRGSGSLGDALEHGVVSRRPGSLLQISGGTSGKRNGRFGSRLCGQVAARSGDEARRQANEGKGSRPKVGPSSGVGLRGWLGSVRSGMGRVGRESRRSGHRPVAQPSRRENKDLAKGRERRVEVASCARQPTEGATVADPTALQRRRRACVPMERQLRRRGGSGQERAQAGGQTKSSVG